MSDEIHSGKLHVKDDNPEEAGKFLHRIAEHGGAGVIQTNREPL